jgi:hypothetical protein
MVTEKEELLRHVLEKAPPQNARLARRSMHRDYDADASENTFVYVVGCS